MVVLAGGFTTAARGQGGQLHSEEQAIIPNRINAASATDENASCAFMGPPFQRLRYYHLFRSMVSGLVRPPVAAPAAPPIAAPAKGSPKRAPPSAPAPAPIPAPDSARSPGLVPHAESRATNTRSESKDTFVFMMFLSFNVACGNQITRAGRKFTTLFAAKAIKMRQRTALYQRHNEVTQSGHERLRGACHLLS